MLGTGKESVGVCGFVCADWEAGGGHVKACVEESLRKRWGQRKRVLSASASVSVSVSIKQTEKSGSVGDREREFYRRRGRKDKLGTEKEKGVRDCTIFGRDAGDREGEYA
jgi:hypothetical protein